MRDRVLNGEIEERDCDDTRVFKFLKSLKRQRNTSLNNRESGVTKERWMKIIKQSKKRSTSSIFFKRTYLVYKCALESE